MNLHSNNKQTRIIFITGGARSGKSSFALRQAEKIDGRKLFIATAQPLDAEMAERVKTHREERSPEWDTAEVSSEIGETLENNGPYYQVILIDCLTLWLFNVMGGHAETSDCETKVIETIDTLMNRLQDVQRSPQRFENLSSIFFVSNEVGMGIVPGNRSARIFRDMAGRLNQKVAQIADEVYLMVSGLPLQLKR
ncbi:MAG: bifunctional adenosylcobinamide kinase/adenosylcobinamide-phosphate guanylyltransferase [Desulfobacterales bacterium]|nr:bifunctional adenosylcobinamide kinase/adenosylcobinamide-phosphate guanylyltransferase [Desulfobacterales bacterium]